METEVLLGIVTGVQSVLALWLRAEVRRNACGGRACLKALDEYTMRAYGLPNAHGLPVGRRKGVEAVRRESE